MSETPEDHAAELAAWRKEAAGAFADLAAEFGIGAKTNLSVDQISAALRKRLEHARLPMHDRLGMIVEALGLIAGDTKWGHLGWDDVVAGVKALKGRVERAEAGLERFREVVEAKLPEYVPGAEDWREGPVGAEGVRLITEMTRELAMAMSVPLPVSWVELITKAAELEQAMGRRCVCCGAPPSHHPNDAVGCDAFVERRWKDETKAKPRCLYRHEAGADLCQLEAGHDGFGHPALSRTTSLEQASIASLRAELTALGKHVEDVERRAYDTPTKAAFGDCLNKTLEVEQRIRLGEEMAKRIDQKLDTRANAISIDYYAMRARIDALEENRPSPKPDNLGMTYAERLALASAGKAETLEAVRSLTDAMQALDAKVDDLAAGWGSCGPSRTTPGYAARVNDPWRGPMPADEPLDLATLRVPCDLDPGDVAYLETETASGDTRTFLTVEYDNKGEWSGHRRIALKPDTARLLARALTQWADGAEKGAEK